MSAPDGYVRVCRLADLRPGRGHQVMLEDHPVALWMVDGEVYAIDGLCPHQHIPAMHNGMLDGNTVVCPMHGWTFRLENGEEVEGNGRIRRFDLLVEGGRCTSGGVIVREEEK